jgi:hypothetical protein
VHRPAPRARVRSGLTAAAVALLVGAGLAACTTSTPGQASPSAPAATTRAPEPQPTESLLPEAAGSTSSAVGELVDGFPATLVPVPDGAQVLLSSAEPVAGTDLTRISLNLRSGQDAAGLLDTVRTALVAAGFTESAPPAPEPGLAAQSAFSRGDGSELLVVGILDRDDERTLTLGGQVRAPTP